MGIKGENLNGVYGGNTLLDCIQKDIQDKIPDFENKNIAIIGGGNVAMDCARTFKKMGAQSVKIIYRRAKEQMPAEKCEIEQAVSEGIELIFQTNIVSINGDKHVQEIECIKTELILKNGEERPVPIDIPNSNYTINTDYVITAIGSQPEIRVTEKTGMQLNKNGYINVDENYKTSDEKIWAGGDIINNKATVAWAALTGKKAAENIDKYFKK